MVLEERLSGARALSTGVQTPAGAISSDTEIAGLPASAWPAGRRAVLSPGQPLAPRSTPSQTDDAARWHLRHARNTGTTAGIWVQLLASQSLSTEEQAETRVFTRHVLGASQASVRPFRLPADQYGWAPPEWTVLVKAGGHVVSQAGILYRVVRVGDQRVVVGGIGGVMTLPGWRGRGYARAVLTKAAAFVRDRLGASFLAVICPAESADLYRALGWQGVDAPISCDQPGERVTLTNELMLVWPCQGLPWPEGPVDLCGLPW